MGGNKQQPGTSSHPDLNPARTRPSNPCISNHATLPKTEIALSTQDSNSQHRGSPQKITPLKSFCSLSPQATPLSVYVPAFSKMSVGVFFLLVLRSREPLAGWGALERWLPVHPDQRQSSTTRRAQHMCRANAPTGNK